jgi:GNAT superfamily N-acetyltransferase
VIVVRDIDQLDDPAVYGGIVRDSYLSIPDYPPDPEYDATLDRVSERMAHGRVAVALDDGIPVGCLTLVLDPASPLHDLDAEHDPDSEGLANLRMFAVDGTRQGRGIGRAMLEWCEQQTRHAGLIGIGLHTIGEMRAAVRLYESYGFVREQRWDREYCGAWGMGYVLRFAPLPAADAS